MRAALAVLALLAPPVLAAPPVPAPVVPPEVTRALADPATAERLGRVAEVLSKALLAMPAGEIEAAIEGRPATAADRARTVRDIARIDDPDFERRLAADTAASGRVMQAGAQAMVKALPGLLASLEGVRGDLERAIANLPRPDYPRR